ncbi:MAG: protein phosphatase 2C domain-containing protein [Thermoleophilia bacterium]|nr:protein phosphatase 2C domain-containing protein [Thermoleophilia bacterium]
MPPETDASRTETPTDTDDYLPFDDTISRLYEAEPRCRIRVDFAARTHPGNVRPHNEDQYLVVRRRERQIIGTSLPVELLPRPEQSAYVAAVADGMGGAAFGELASYLALQVSWDLGTDEIKWPMKNSPRETDEIRRKARILFRTIDRKIFEAAAEQPKLAGMGTTLTLCYSVGPELHVFHAGDSRAYLMRGDALTPLTHDHTLGQAMVDAGLAAPDSPEARRRKHVLTNVLGGPGLGISVDMEHRRLAHGDKILLCTDGLTDLVKDDEIARILGAAESSDRACRALVDLALERGGRDNVTVIVGRYDIGPEDDELDDL